MTDISRRSISKSVAWTIPSVTIAASAPAVAASCQPKNAAISVGDGGVDGNFEDDRPDLTIAVTNTSSVDIPAGQVLPLQFREMKELWGSNPTAITLSRQTATMSGSTYSGSVDIGTLGEAKDYTNEKSRPYFPTRPDRWQASIRDSSDGSITLDGVIPAGKSARLGLWFTNPDEADHTFRVLSTTLTATGEDSCPVTITVQGNYQQSYDAYTPRVASDDDPVTPEPEDG